MVFSDLSKVVAVLNKPGHKFHGHPARVLEDNEMVQAIRLQFIGPYADLFNTPETKLFYIGESKELEKILSEGRGEGCSDALAYAIMQGMNPGRFKREFKEIFGRKVPFRVTLRDYVSYISRKINRYS